MAASFFNVLMHTIVCRCSFNFDKDFIKTATWMGFSISYFIGTRSEGYNSRRAMWSPLWAPLINFVFMWVLERLNLFTKVLTAYLFSSYSYILLPVEETRKVFKSSSLCAAINISIYFDWQYFTCFHLLKIILNLGLAELPSVAGCRVDNHHRRFRWGWELSLHIVFHQALCVVRFLFKSAK